jgi:hypothetical protein
MVESQREGENGKLNGGCVFEFRTKNGTLKWGRE